VRPAFGLAAFGGNLSLAWWLLRVAPQARCPRCQCDDVGMSGSVEAGIQRVLEEVGVTGFVHARAIDHDREIALGPIRRW